MCTLRSHTSSFLWGKRFIFIKEFIFIQCESEYFDSFWELNQRILIQMSHELSNWNTREYMTLDSFENDFEKRYIEKVQVYTIHFN